MVELKNVTKKFRKSVILDDINCKLDKGIYGLLGANGAGKTTLMRCMTGVYSLSCGKVLIDGEPMKRKTGIGYLPQSFGLFKELNVYDSMNYFCNLKGIKKKDRKEQIMRCIRAVNMEAHLKKKGRELSGGMMRRVGVAQALLNNPKCILFDEPTSGLDIEERIRFKKIISTLDKDKTVIISTHIVEDIEACCDKVVIMNQGRILRIMSCRDLEDYAYGKVIACKKGEESGLKCSYFVEKQFERKGNVYYRVLVEDTRTANNFEMLEPTIEDGYILLVKDI